MADPISVLVERGGVVEAHHLVHAVAVRDGTVVDAAGDPGLVTLMRSAAKPFQALPLAGADAGLSDEELAIACASHEATPEQLAAVRALLARSGSDEAELECGAEHGLRVGHNCAGKHAGMLLRAKREGWPLPGYRLPGHPVQEEARRLVAAACGVDPDALATATDGCGVVTFALSLEAMARAFEELGSGALPGSERVAATMRARPDLIGGRGAPDTAYMHALPGSLAKRGAEGLLCAALPEGTGVAVKVADGGDRAAGPALARFTGVATSTEVPVRNSRGERVGRVFAAP